MSKTSRGNSGRMECYITTIETLLSTMGLKCFQLLENKNIKKKDILSCTDKYGSFGEGEYTEEGFLLYKGAKCKLQMHKGTKHIAQRDELIASGLLKKKKIIIYCKTTKSFLPFQRPPPLCWGAGLTAGQSGKIKTAKP